MAGNNNTLYYKYEIAYAIALLTATYAIIFRIVSARSKRMVHYPFQYYVP